MACSEVKSLRVMWLVKRGTQRLKSNNGMLNFTFFSVDFADGNLYKRCMCKVDTLHLISRAINFPRYSAPWKGLRVSPKQFSHLLGWFCTCGPLLTCLMLSCCRPPLSALSFLSPLTCSVMSAAPTDRFCISLCVSFPSVTLRENTVLLENVYNVFIENVFERDIKRPLNSNLTLTSWIN